MTTAHTKPKSAKDAPVAAASITDYLDTLSDSHEKLTASLKEGRERARRVSEEVTDAMLAGQRDMLVIARQFAGNPTDVSANTKALMDAATAAQERSLNLGKLVYGEQVQVGAELRKFWESSLATPPNFMASMPKLGDFGKMGSWFATPE